MSTIVRLERVSPFLARSILFLLFSLFFFELLERILFSIHTDESTIKSTRAFFCCAVTCDLLLLSGRSHSMKISRVNNSAYVCLVRMSGLGFFKKKQIFGVLHDFLKIISQLINFKDIF